MNLWECEPWGPRAVTRPTSPTMLLSPVVAPDTNQTLPDIWHHLDFSTYHHDQTLKWIKVGFLSWTLSWVDQTPRKNILCCYLFTSWIWEAFLLEISAQTILPTRHSWAMYQLILLLLSWTLLVGKNAIFSVFEKTFWLPFYNNKKTMFLSTRRLLRYLHYLHFISNKISKIWNFGCCWE